MKTKSKVLVSALLAIVLCVSLIAGATFALFTSESSVNIAVTAGKVEVVAAIKSITTSQGTAQVVNNKAECALANGGLAKVDGKEVSFEGFTPGEEVTLTIGLTNESTVTAKYRSAVSCTQDGGLFEALSVGYSGDGAWRTINAKQTIADEQITISFPEAENNNDYQGKSCTLTVAVEAVQGNAAVQGAILPQGVTASRFVEEEAVAYAGETYYPTLKAAIQAGEGDVYLAPNAQLTEEMTHAHVKGNINIYGNGATLVSAGGEHDLEVDTYPAQGALTGETTINIYDLDGVAVWGQRTSDVTLNINLFNCQQINRVYISGTKGINNITLTNCSGDKTGYNCKVYSNASGTIKVSNCNFENVAEPINLNHKSGSVQNVYVENCKFTDCSTTDICVTDALWAAPIRVISSAEGGVSNLHLKDIVCEYNVGKTPVNGNLLTVELRAEPCLGTVNVSGEEEIQTIKHVNNLADYFTDYNFGCNTATVTDAVLEPVARETLIVEKWQDVWFGGNLTIRNIIFKQGISLSNDNANEKTLTVENCEIYACNQELLREACENNANYRIDNSGDGMCLDVESGAGKENLIVNVKNCHLVGENDKTLDRNGYQNAGYLLANNRNKSRGYGVCMGAAAGKLVAKKVVIDGCTFDGIRGNAIQVSNIGYDLTIQNCTINSWGNNRQTSALEKSDSAIRGDLLTGGTITLNNITFGLDQANDLSLDKGVMHVNINNFDGNTAAAQSAGTYFN